MAIAVVHPLSKLGISLDWRKALAALISENVQSGFALL